jgi:hypothetical protein
MKVLNEKNTILILVGLISLVIIFHLLILFKIIPSEIAWGGRLKTEQEMFVFETVSVALNLFLIWILTMKVKQPESKIINIVLWLFFVVFILNTVGNLFAHTNLEKLFSILTFVLAILILRILMKGK